MTSLSNKDGLGRRGEHERAFSLCGDVSNQEFPFVPFFLGP